jgi:peptide chain release factor 3
MQVVFPIYGRREPILGVVGALQFDVVAARLKSEYGVECDIDRLKYSIARWVTWTDGAATTELKLPTLGVLQTVDREERPVLLFESNWELQYCERENPAAKFLAVA